MITQKPSGNKYKVTMCAGDKKSAVFVYAKDELDASGMVRGAFKDLGFEPVNAEKYSEAIPNIEMSSLVGKVFKFTNLGDILWYERVVGCFNDRGLEKLVIEEIADDGVKISTRIFHEFVRGIQNGTRIEV